MSGIEHFKTILSIFSIGVAIVVALRIYNIIADIEIFGFKLPKIRI